MSAYAVIGANYGDEGKGLITDYLCRRENADLVVRFNGGAQAGHTVVTPEGLRHVFGHFGSGTLAGVPTFLSRFFVCNPALFVSELDRLMALPGFIATPKVHVDSDCLVTTPWDMMINQAVEKARGFDRHGSCGVGFGETIERSMWFDPIKAGELGDKLLRKRVNRILNEWLPLRAAELRLGPLDITDAEAITDRFLQDCNTFFNHCVFCVNEEPLRSSKRIIYEGAQGLLLDMNAPSFPHVTRSKTGIINAAALHKERTKLIPVYVTRTYLTRHGAGPLEHETKFPAHIFQKDKTNLTHPFQGGLRYAPLVWHEMDRRIRSDSRKHFGAQVAVTWADVEPVPEECKSQADMISYGPTAMHVMQKRQTP